MRVQIRVLAGLLCAALTAACGVIKDVAAPMDRDRLVADMTKQLHRGARLSYQAEYQLAGGHRAHVGQATSKTAYGYPGGLLLVADETATICDIALTPARCEIRPRAGQLTPYLQVAKKGLMTPAVLEDLLRLTTLQPAANVKGHDTTVAGLQASCLEVLGLNDAVAPNFVACVTADGVIANFSGLVDGTNVDLALTQVTLKAPDEEMFSLPAKANVVDLRQA